MPGGHDAAPPAAARRLKCTKEAGNAPVEPATDSEATHVPSRELASLAAVKAAVGGKKRAKAGFAILAASMEDAAGSEVTRLPGQSATSLAVASAAASGTMCAKPGELVPAAPTRNDVHPKTTSMSAQAAAQSASLVAARGKRRASGAAEAVLATPAGHAGDSKAPVRRKTRAQMALANAADNAGPDAAAGQSSDAVSHAVTGKLAQAVVHGKRRLSSAETAPAVPAKGSNGLGVAESLDPMAAFQVIMDGPAPYARRGKKVAQATTSSPFAGGTPSVAARDDAVSERRRGGRGDARGKGRGRRACDAGVVRSLGSRDVVIPATLCTMAEGDGRQLHIRHSAPSLRLPRAATKRSAVRQQVEAGRGSSATGSVRAAGRAGVSWPGADHPCERVHVSNHPAECGVAHLAQAYASARVIGGWESGEGEDD